MFFDILLRVLVAEQNVLQILKAAFHAHVLIYCNWLRLEKCESYLGKNICPFLASLGPNLKQIISSCCKPSRGRSWHVWIIWVLLVWHLKVWSPAMFSYCRMRSSRSNSYHVRPSKQKNKNKLCFRRNTNKNWTMDVTPGPKIGCEFCPKLSNYSELSMSHFTLYCWFTVHDMSAMSLFLCIFIYTRALTGLPAVLCNAESASQCEHFSKFISFYLNSAKLLSSQILFCNKLTDASSKTAMLAMNQTCTCTIHFSSSNWTPVRR